MQNSGVEELLTIGVDVVLFIFSLTIIISMTSQGNEIANKVRKDMTNNETVTISEYDIETNGYYEDGTLKYDGQYEGEEVLFTINSLKDVVVKISTENNVINLNTTLYQNRTLLDYVQHVDAGYLRRYIDINKQYTKEYVINAHGDIIEVIFSEIR